MTRPHCSLHQLMINELRIEQSPEIYLKLTQFRCYSNFIHDLISLRISITKVSEI